jgi:hypothetical protein
MTCLVKAIMNVRWYMSIEPQWNPIFGTSIFVLWFGLVIIENVTEAFNCWDLSRERSVLNEKYVIWHGLNVAMQWFGILLRIQEVPSWNLGSRADCGDFSSSVIFLSAPKEIFLFTLFPVRHTRLMQNSTHVKCTLLSRCFKQLKNVQAFLWAVMLLSRRPQFYSGQGEEVCLHRQVRSGLGSSSPPLRRMLASTSSYIKMWKHEAGQSPPSSASI